MMYQTKVMTLSGQAGFENRIRVFWSLAAICILSLGIYIYAVHATIRNTVARQDLETQVANLAAQEGSLEFSYIEDKNKIDMEVAYAHGFKDTSAPIYISRAESNSLSYNSR